MTSSQDPSSDDRQAKIAACRARYWRSNVRIMLSLLLAWAIAGLGCGVLWADWLNDLGDIGGFPLGFWFAQQGSIIVFVLLVLVYALLMGRLDRRHQQQLQAIDDSVATQQGERP